MIPRQQKAMYKLKPIRWISIAATIACLNSYYTHVDKMDLQTKSSTGEDRGEGTNSNLSDRLPLEQPMLVFIIATIAVTKVNLHPK